MLILGIETSCDDTGLALASDRAILAERLASQADVHSLFGGVVPEIASREHLRMLAPLFAGVLRDAGASAREITDVAVARGPGLLGSLLVGLSLAKGLSLATGARLIGVDHLAAHLLAPGIDEELRFPAIGLLASGGHTHLYRIDSPVAFRLLGRTLDDAAGEAFDKAAKLFNLPYPGGRFIDLLGALAAPDPKLFPRPYLANQNLDFSFSGLKTAVAAYVAAHPGLRRPRQSAPDEIMEHPEAFADLSLACSSLNYAVEQTLRVKTERALNANPDAASLIVAGGVAANSVIRRSMTELARERGLALHLPRPSLCGDNAAMIAHMGRLLAARGLGHDLSLEVIPRGTIVPWDYLDLGARDG
ncbi:MAG: tRNA (adenosine(37)-N6)-threonylcarbamoyltransferase complex transferase subunit TsaD [Desulfovibrionaceae bacterium]|nr:tRNA (adenosine(37)-N6)-threonylcarbamoyltransferase complex transferase subunit TsaD [Desulfovibrionaceae bacterium]MBF0514297.1 tRNA (adenosine(37)-N6)-threonylcarbamoyltransferase complex transferase subunit TsaD [Desulfovibrionaceae bacterium]